MSPPRPRSCSPLKALIGAGADVGVRDGSGRTALHMAKGKAVAAVLLKAGADVDAEDDEGKAPAETALNSGAKTEIANWKENEGGGGANQEL